MSTQTGARTPGRRRRVILTMGAAFAVVLIAAGLVVRHEARTVTLTTGNVSTLVTGVQFRAGGGASDVGYGGDLQLIADRCVGLTYRGELRLVIWPRGTTVTGTDGSVSIRSGGHTFKIGDKLQYGVEDLASTTTHLSLPGPCRGRATVTVFGPDHTS